jgi:PadR family transcriptional regulator
MRRPSKQTVLVLEALAATPAGWRHGYDLARETGLASGSLYPILMRLAERGQLVSRWEDGVDGRPPRHSYRLTADGLATLASATPVPRLELRPSPGLS